MTDGVGIIERIHARARDQGADKPTYLFVCRMLMEHFVAPAVGQLTNLKFYIA